VAVPAGQLLPIPKGWGLEEAAALPEAALTSWTHLVVEGGLRSGESVLITAATSGVGTFAVQLARELGARVFAAGRDYERLEATRLFGASGLLLLDDTLPARVRAATDGVGADLCLDLVGGGHLNRALGALAPGGRLVLVGLMSGREATVDLSVVLRRGLRLVGATLRARPRAEKAELVAGFRRFATDLLDRRRLLPVIDSVFDFDEIALAYRRLEKGRPFGKIVVRLVP
jgi:NADPH:quinone reductase-like Zn-dependent oxidoreductase